MAQRPNWVFNKPEPGNETYLYVVESATGQTENDARNKAIAEVMRTTAMLIGMPFDMEEINRALQSGSDYNLVSAKYDIPILKVCEYVDKTEIPCRVYILCQVAKSGEYKPNFNGYNACYEVGGNYYAENALYVDGYSVYRNGVQLSDDEIRTMFANTKSYYLYDKGKRIEKRDQFSDGFEYVFGFLALLSAGCFELAGAMSGGWEVGKGWFITGIVVGGCGIGLIALPSIRSSRGRNKIRKAVDLYNNGKAYSQNNLEFKYGLTGNGVFLSFSF